MERHRAEIRRAVNDERLNTIAYYSSGPNTSTEWAKEGRRLIPLMPRLVPQTAFTSIANAAANVQVSKDASLLPPSSTGTRSAEYPVESSSTSTKRRKLDNHSQFPVQGPPTIVPIKNLQTNVVMDSSMITNTVQRNFQSVNLKNTATLQKHVQSGAASKSTVYSGGQRVIVTSAGNTPFHFVASNSASSTSGARVIFVSAPPTSSGTILTSGARPTSLGSIPFVARPVVATSPTRHNFPARVVTTRAIRSPATVSPVIGVINPSVQKQIRTSTSKSSLSGVTVAQVMATIPFPQGTKVFTKTGGHQQVVVFPVNQKPITIPISQQMKIVDQVVPATKPLISTSSNDTNSPNLEISCPNSSQSSSALAATSSS